jgi:hypothetical protein
MKEVAINTAVDVKLNHADMVEFLIEEQSEILENQLIELRKTYQELMESNDAIKKQIDDQVKAEIDIENNPDTKDIMKYIKSSKLSVNKNMIQISWLSSNTVSYYDMKKRNVFDYDCQLPLPDYDKRGALTALNELKSRRESMLSFPNLIEEPIHGINYYAYSRITQVGISINASNDSGLYVRISLPTKSVNNESFKPSRKVKALYKKLDVISEKLAANHKEQYHVNLQLAEINCGGKRHKAKFLKAMLNQSDSGQQLLDLMKSVTSTNLLK